MDIKMPENKEKKIEKNNFPDDNLKEFGGAVKTAPKTADFKRAATQEEDDWEWLEAIKASISDDFVDDDFIPPFLDEEIMSHEESVPDTHREEPQEKESEKTDEKKSLFPGFGKRLKKQPEIEAEPITEDREAKAEEVKPEPTEPEEKQSFWQRLGDLVGVNEVPETAAKKEKTPKAIEDTQLSFDDEPETLIAEEVKDAESEPVRKPKYDIKIIEADQFREPKAKETPKPEKPEQLNLEELFEIKEEASEPNEEITYADSEYDAVYSEIVDETIDEGEEKEKKSFPPIFAKIFAYLGMTFSVLREKHREQKARELADDEIKDPKDMAREARRYARPVGSLTFRSRFAFLISLFMLLLAGVFELSGKGWLGIGSNGVLMTGVLLVMQLFVMLLCVEVPLRGICSLIKGKVTAETLIAASCFVSFLDGIIVLLGRNSERGLPFAVVSAFSVVFGMRGLRSYYIGMRNSLRVAVRAKAPWGIVTDDESVQDRSVLKRVPGAVDGFYKNLIRRDICEHIYTYAAPIMLIAALVFAFLSTVVRGRGGEFIHALGALVAISASFSCMSAYSGTFRLISSIARRGGCAVAGWAGADKIASSDGAFITDNDLFPQGTQSISGIRLMGIAGDYKAVECAGSLIIASGSGLENPFREFMRANHITPVHVERFTCYEGGGIGGVIRGENILVGTMAFMNLMGVRMPDDIRGANAVFLAINRKLAAVFTVSYTPSNAVQSSLLAMRNTKVNMLFALKDFNVSPKMLQKKFKVSMDGVEYIPVSDCYKIEQEDELHDNDAAGIVSLGNLTSFAQVASKAAQLRQITRLNTAVSLLGSAAGMFLVFRMCWNGPISSVTSWAMVLFMFAMHLVTIILSNLVKRKN